MPGRTRRVRGRLPTRVVRGVVLLVLGTVLASCQLRTELNITVESDGSGEVELALALDEEAVERRPDLVEELDLGDLTETGWEVSGPVEEADGNTWIRARHRFGAPGELAALVDEVAGEDGPFRDFSLAREVAFADTTHRFRGTVDFTRGVAGVAEASELTEALGAEQLELLEERVGAAVDELIVVQVAVRLPGSVESNAPTQASNGALWRPSVLEREAVELSASGTVRRTQRLVWLGVAVAAGFVLFLYTLIRVVAWRRRTGVPDGSS